MAKEQTDRTTLDLFADERRPGRPKANPLSRDEQLRINKRNQLKRDKVREIAELKMPDLNASSVETAMLMVEGTARSMGIVIED